jgi:hypothetical protein
MRRRATPPMTSSPSNATGSPVPPAIAWRMRCAMPPGSPSSAAPIRARRTRPARASRCAGLAATPRAARCCCSTACRRPIRSAAGSRFPPICPNGSPVRASPRRRQRLCRAGRAGRHDRADQRQPRRSRRAPGRARLWQPRQRRRDGWARRRSASGFVTLAGQYARGDGFTPIVEEDRGPVDRPAPYEQASLALRASPISAATPNSRPMSRPSPTDATAASISPR